MSNFLASKSYLALKPQVAPGTPIIPSNFFALVSESIRINPNFTADRRMKGLDWKSDDLLKGSRKIEGDIVVLGDPEVLGHLLNMTYLKGTTTGDAASGYTHPFTVGDGDSYSIEIPRGNYAQRIWGARAESLKVDYEDNKAKITVSIKALGQFFSASLAVALTGAGMTTIVLSTDSDLRPSDGLVIGDKVIVGGVELTLTSVNVDGKTIGFASTTVTASVGDPVMLKAQTPSLGTQREPLYLGNTLAGIAPTSALADTAAGSRATATPCYNLSFTLKNNLLDAPASGYTGPAALLNQVKEAQIEISRLFETAGQHQKWIENVKQAITLIATGRFIKTDLSTSEKLTVKFHNTKLITNEEPLDAGGYIFDKQSFEALYDNSDGKAIEIELVNRTADTAY
jgi:hypothetical protein